MAAAGWESVARFRAITRVAAHGHGRRLSASRRPAANASNARLDPRRAAFVCVLRNSRAAKMPSSSAWHAGTARETSASIRSSRSHQSSFDSRFHCECESRCGGAIGWFGVARTVERRDARSG